MTHLGAGKRSKRRVLIGILTVLFCVYLAWVFLVFLAQDMLVFPRFMVQSGGRQTAPAGVEEWTIDTEDGAVHAWFIRGGGCSDGSPCGTVVMMHGNGMLIDDWMDMAGGFTAMGWNVLLPEFRGYGRAAGKPSEQALRDDAVAFIDLLNERSDADPGAIVYYGRSLGGALAAQVARDREPAGMILQTPPASIAAMAWRYGAPPFLVRNRFDTVAALRDGPRVETLLIEHDKDRIIPASHLASLREAASHAKPLLLQGGHDVLANASQEQLFLEEVEAFLDSIKNDSQGQ